MEKKVIVLSDLHCGHRVGLTPPKYQNTICGEKAYLVQKELWSAFTTEILKIKMECKVKNIPLIAVWLGDLVTGKEPASGSTEVFAPDRFTQAEIAEECIKEVNANINKFVYGTSYHTGKSEDVEKIIADHFNEEIRSQIWLDINGVIFDCKHHISGSSVPHSRATSILKERLWNLLWNEIGEQPRADVFCRGHNHYFMAVQDHRVLAISVPALQGQGTKYGARRCSGLVNVGLVEFNVFDQKNNKSRYTWNKKIFSLKAHIRKAEAL